MAEVLQQDIPNKERLDRITPGDALRLLKDGNARFVSGAMANRDLLAQVTVTANGQFPFAAILGCIDSRVPPEQVFDRGVGDLFVARVAGNFASIEILGSLEFATEIAGARLIVVLGHKSCGAVTGVCNRVEMGHLTQTLSHIEPAVRDVERSGAIRSGETDFVEAVAAVHAKRTAVHILSASPIIQKRVADGLLRVVSAMYDVNTGRVTFFEES